tara:strand:- start:13668 stop:15719 length:2052 start_codon:yes stop_codon:yes gene_type:complete
VEKKLKTLTIIQARTGSSRLPGKVLKKFNKISYLELMIRRLKKSKTKGKIIVATTKNKKDDQISRICNILNITCFRGSEIDVIDRYYQAAKKFNAKNIIRLTADCPLIDPKVLDKVVNSYFLTKVDYATNTMPPTYPDGMDVEIFNFKSLNTAWKKSRKLKNLREHVTTHIRQNKKAKKTNICYKKDFSGLRITLDETADLKTINNILKSFSNIYSFGIDDVIKLYKKKKKLFRENMHLKRDNKKNLSSGQKTWQRAKKIIPGGTMLFSKNPDLFLPGKWPAYFKKSKGCKIWDLDGNCFNDLSYMGVGTNILGYSHPRVEKKVIRNIKFGSMTSLNSKEEIYLAEKLVDMHNWSEMVRFTRSGGEANAVAIRIARAASGKDKIAVCGYHGWHDWYLSSNINSPNNLNNHLMNNVPILGVPKALRNTVFTFNYNDFNTLNKIVSKHKIGVIKMEVKRNEEPKNNFLKKVRKLANDKKIVLIFDECTSGFRETFGGLHKKYNVNPDLAIFGKALGNGYAINAIIGKRSVMNFCASTFISSTFWTERIGPTAALETLKIMEEEKSWKKITELGKSIKQKWHQISKNNNVKIKIQGIDAIPNFVFFSKKNLLYKTYITQEMLKDKILASNAIYCSLPHNNQIMKKYFNKLNDIFTKISKFENGNEKVEDFIKTDVCISGLRDNKQA